ncbi:MAG: cytochrome c [Gemmatimonadota bacterium]
MSRLRFALAAAVLWVLLPPARVAAQQPTDSAAARLALGKRLFESKGLCFSCHGKDGEGMLGPTTRLTAGKSWIHTKGSLSEIAQLVKSGIESEKSQSGTAMPPRGGSRLSDAEVDLVAAYVLELHRRTPNE